MYPIANYISVLRKVLLVALLVFCREAKGQKYFQKRIDPGILCNFSETSHTPTADSGFVLLNKNYAFAAGMQENYLIRTDKEGTILWNKTCEFPSGFGFSSIIATADNGCILTGVIPSTTAVPRRWLHLVKLDANGNVVWEKSYGGANFYNSYTAIYNGELYVGGTYCTDITDDDTAIFIMRAGLDGALNGFNSSVATHGEVINGIAVTASGIVVLCGTTFRVNVQGNPLLVIIEQDLKFRYFYDVSLAGSSDTYGVTTSGEKIWTTGTHKLGSTEGSFIINFQSPLIHTGKFALVSHNRNVSFFGVSTAADGLPVFCGQVTRNGQGHFSGALAKINDNMGLVWALSYGDTNIRHKKFTSVYNSPGGAISAAGISVYNHYYGCQLIQTSELGITDCKQSAEVLQLQTGNFNSGIYFPDSAWLASPYAAFSGMQLDSIKPLFAEKVCVTDSCRAGFIVNRDTLCAGDSITVTDTAKYASVFQWEFQNGTPATYTGNNPPAVVYSAPGYYRVRLIVANPLNIDTAEGYVKVWPKATAHAGPDTTICLGNTIALQGGGGVAYRWQPATYLNDSTIAAPLANPATGITYFLTVTDTNGCTAHDTVKVAIALPPQTTVFDTTLCDNQTLLLDAQNTGYIYQWSTGQTTKTIVAPTGSHYVIISSSCFTDTSYYTINSADCRLVYYIPNAFTPDDNGLNDTFAIGGEGIDSISIVIYNRWGEAVYKSNGPFPAWDGRFNNIPCPANPYIFIADIYGILQERKTVSGIVNLLR